MNVIQLKEFLQNYYNECNQKHRYKKTSLYITNNQKQKIIKKFQPVTFFSNQSIYYTKMSTSRITSQSIDQQIGTLLAFVILFEKKIQKLRIKLAGNEEFHSRLAFQLLDKRRKCVFSAEDLNEALNRYSSSKPNIQTEAFCRKYTANGTFSYDDLRFLKFLTPKTNKSLAQRLMIRTYRSGAQLPGYVITLLFQVLQSAISMLSITQNLRKQIQESTQLTHIEILQFFKKCCSSKQKLFYFINASTDGQGDYDFTQEEMKYLTFHVKGSCDLEDLGDQQIKQILYPIDMNYQKTSYNMTATNGFGDVKNRTDYFKTKSALNKANENNESNNKASVNFLNTNYRQTSKGGFYKPQKNNFQSKEQLFTEPVEQNVQTRLPVAMNFMKNFPNGQQQSIRLAGNYQIPGPNIIPSQQRQSQWQNDASEVSSINYGNLYIEKFANGSQQPLGISRSNNGNRSSGVKELDGFLFERFQNQKRKEIFKDEFRRREDIQSIDNISDNSAFMQY